MTDTQARAEGTVAVPAPVHSALRASPEQGASARFAAAVVARAGDDWRLREIDITESDQGITLGLTLVGARSARRYDLIFSADGNRVTGYRQRAVAVPRERREYQVEAELIRMLSIAPPQLIEEACGSYFLDGLDAGLAIDSLGYSITEKRVSGTAAQTAAAAALIAALDAGAQLIAVEEAETTMTGTVRTIEFSLAGDSDRVIAVGLDRGDWVSVVEVRRVPFIQRLQRYTRSAQLRAALAQHKALRTLGIRELAPATDDATVVLNNAVTIDMGDFEPGEYVCPC
ncbi:MAG: hypothetical protein AAGC55_22410 [Myxococcota bacterium]